MNERIVQRVDIRADKRDVFEELVLWGESAWWPEACRMRFENTSGFVGEGTLYRQKVRLPFGPAWFARNESVDKNKLYIKRVFSEGMFDGFEEISAGEGDSGARAHYVFCVSVKGVINRFFWRFWARPAHIKNIDVVLGALKHHLEAKEKEK